MLMLMAFAYYTCILIINTLPKQINKSEFELATMNSHNTSSSVSVSTIDFANMHILWKDNLLYIPKTNKSKHGHESNTLDTS